MMVERVDGKSVLEIAEEQNGFQKCVDAKVDINSSDLSNTKTSQKKKRRRKKRELSDSTINSLGSIEEGASPSCIVEPPSCVIEPPSCVDASSTTKKKRRKKKKKISDSTLGSLGSIKEGASPTCVDVNSTVNQDNDQVQVDINSCVLSNVKTNHGKKRRRNKRKLYNSTVSILGSIQEGAFPAVLVVESSVRDDSSDHLDKAPAGYLEKIMGDEVAGNAISTKNNDDHDQVDINSCDLSSVKRNQGKKRRRKRIKFSDSTMNSSEPIEEGAAPLVVVVEDKSISCLESIKEGASPSVLVYSDKITGGKVAGDGTSFLVAGNVSIGKASWECLDGESAYGELEKNIKMENLEKLTNGHIVEKNASRRKKRRRKRIKFSDSTMNSSEPIEEGAAPSVLVVEDKSISCLESIKEGASPSVLVLQNSSVRDTSSDLLDEAPACCSNKITGEKVAGDDTSFLVAGNISIGKASWECLDGESAYGEQEKKIKMENLEELTNGHNVEKNASRGKKRRRKRIKFSDSAMNSSEPIEEGAAPSVLVVEDKSISCLGSIKEVASPSVLVVQDSSVRHTSSNPLDEAPACYSDKITGEKVAGDGTSLLVAGNILIGKTSCECLDGESTYGELEKKIKMENLEELTNGHIVEKNTSWVDLTGKEIEQGNEDKSSTICEDKASDGASGADSSVENLESDNLGVKPKLSDEIPLSSVLGVISDNDSLAVAVKEGPLQKLESSPPGSLRKKLLVLDVNGLLADIVPCVSGRYKPDTFVSGKAVFKRPFYDDFLQFCFERFHVAIWSSRTKKNVKSVLDFLMGKSKHNLLFCWDQSHCTYTGFNTVENREKPLLLKELNKIWEKHDPDLPWVKGCYNKSNTLLLDDSPYKALRNPPNTAIFPHSYQYKDVNDNSLGPGGDLRVYLERLALADDVQKYVELNPFGQRSITKTNLSWSFYLKIIRPASSLEEDANDSLPLQ